MSTFTFKWPKGPNEVILTGTFDNWSKSLFLVKQADGSFELTVPLSASEKILYKYVVDGDWVVSKDEKITSDESGNENNVLEASDLVALKSANGSKIPEAAGLAAATTAVPEGEVKTTVMPKSEPKQTTLGEPGIAILKGDELEAAKALPVEDIDAKAFNEQMTAEEKKKQKKKVKRSQYKKKKKAAAAAAAGGAGVVAANGTANGEGQTEESTEDLEETSPEPETEEQAKKETEEIAKETELDKKEDALVDSEVPEAKDDSKAEEIAAGAAVAGTAAVGTTAAVAASEPAKEVPETTDAAVEAPIEKEVEAPVEKEVEAPAEKEVEAPAEKEVETKDETKPAEEVDVNDPAYHSLDPKAPEKEVTTAPGKPSYNEADEIVIAQGNGDNIAEQIVASENGEVTVEEIQPTESEKQRLTSGIPKDQVKKPAAPKPTSKAATPAKEEKKEKKKGGFLTKLKKIFS